MSESPNGPPTPHRHPKKSLVLSRQHLYVAKGVGLAVSDVSDATDPREIHGRDFPCRRAKPDIQPGER
ncbi:MAG: hypothetical protein ACYC3X_08915 [Pirellulaceae bacterium]